MTRGPKGTTALTLIALTCGSTVLPAFGTPLDQNFVVQRAIIAENKSHSAPNPTMFLHNVYTDEFLDEHRRASEVDGPGAESNLTGQYLGPLTLISIKSVSRQQAVVEVEGASEQKNKPKIRKTIYMYFGPDGLIDDIDPNQIGTEKSGEKLHKLRTLRQDYAAILQEKYEPYPNGLVKVSDEKVATSRQGSDTGHQLPAHNFDLSSPKPQTNTNTKTSASSEVGPPTFMVTNNGVDLPHDLDVLKEVRSDNWADCQGPVEQWSNCKGSGSSTSGVKFIGEFQRGRLSKGAISDPGHGQIEQGNFDLRYGLEGIGGLIFTQRNERFIGYFHQGKRTGFGVYYFAGGKTSEGSYVNDLQEGDFTIKNGVGMPISVRTYVGGLFKTSRPLKPNSEVAKSLPAEIIALPVIVEGSNSADITTLPRCEGETSGWDACRGEIGEASGIGRYGRFDKGALSSGEITFKNSDRVLKGSFKNGTLVGLGEIDQNGSRFIGYFSNGLREGYGIDYSEDDTSRVAGEFVRGLNEGAFYTLDENWKAVGTRVYVAGVMQERDLSGAVTPEAVAERYANACRQYVTAKYTLLGKDVYGHHLRQEVPNYLLMMYGAQRRGSFNNHWFEVFSATLDRFKDDGSSSRLDLPYKYCVFGDNYNVIALDTEERN